MTYGPAPRPLRERFDAGWDADASTGCWRWRGAPIKGGYGRILYRRGFSMMAHRVSWELHHGAIPDGMCVCHRCDVPICVNPDHLFLGTKTDNMVDRDSKGRQAKGEGQWDHRLTEKDVVEIRRRLTAGESQTSIGRDFGVSQVTVSEISRRHTWKHVL